MALVQCIDAKKHITFGDLATDYCRQLTSCFAKAHIVADAFDRYDVKKPSIKSAERERRTKVAAHTKMFQVIEGRNIPDWKKFLTLLTFPIWTHSSLMCVICLSK
jgi:patatin-like phospholipase/acyl hydrolase